MFAPSDTSIPLLAASFGLNRPSSRQYLRKHKNAGAYKINRQILWDPIHIHYYSL